MACSICGRPGHNRRTCPKNCSPDSSNTRTTACKCSKCGEYSYHDARNCPYPVARSSPNKSSKPVAQSSPRRFLEMYADAHVNAAEAQFDATLGVIHAQEKLRLAKLRQGVTNAMTPGLGFQLPSTSRGAYQDPLNQDLFIAAFAAFGI